jgi:hypothetical protein
MDVRYVTYRDSHMAAACLWLAMRMKSEGQWVRIVCTQFNILVVVNWSFLSVLKWSCVLKMQDDTMVHYTGYNYDSLISLVKMLNDMLVSPPFKQLTTIRSKYSHVYVLA